MILPRKLTWNWKITLWKGKSSSKPLFWGSMLVCGSVPENSRLVHLKITNNCGKSSEPNLHDFGVPAVNVSQCVTGFLACKKQNMSSREVTARAIRIPVWLHPWKRTNIYPENQWLEIVFQVFPIEKSFPLLGDDIRSFYGGVGRHGISPGGPELGERFQRQCLSYGLLHLGVWWWVCISVRKFRCLHQRQFVPENRQNRQKPKRNRSYSNHPFSGAMLVSGRVSTFCFSNMASCQHVFCWCCFVCHGFFCQNKSLQL